MVCWKVCVCRKTLFRKSYEILNCKFSFSFWKSFYVCCLFSAHKTTKIKSWSDSCCFFSLCKATGTVASRWTEPSCMFMLHTQYNIVWYYTMLMQICVRIMYSLYGVCWFCFFYSSSASISSKLDKSASTTNHYSSI